MTFVLAVAALSQQPSPVVEQPASISTQEPSQLGVDSGGYTFKVTSHMVVLDVVVTDKHGETVNNLTKDDFGVYEEHTPQTIRSLDHLQSGLTPTRTPVNSTAELDKLEPNAPVSIIVLDEINTPFEDEAFARYSLKRYLNTQGDALLQPTMLVAVNLQRFMVLRDYTTSKKEILSALDHHLNGYPWHLQNGDSASGQFNAAIASLVEVAEATAGHTGHKNMIWIGRGFPGFDLQSLTPDAQMALKSEIHICTNLLRDSRVTVYTIDPAGLSVASPAQNEDSSYIDDPFGGQVDFDAIAKATGGRPFHGHNDVDTLIETSVRDGVDFYTLSYTPSAASDNSKAFRNIHVVMKNSNLHAATREGYYTQQQPEIPAITANGKLSTRLIFDLTVAGQSMLAYDALPITVMREASVTPDRFRIRLDQSALEWRSDSPRERSSDIALLVESFDRKGKMLNRVADILTVHLPPADAASASDIVNMITSIPTALPAARLRFVVRSSNGKLGATNIFLVDPKTLSDPAIGLRSEHSR